MVNANVSCASNSAPGVIALTLLHVRVEGAASKAGAWPQAERQLFAGAQGLSGSARRRQRVWLACSMRIMRPLCTVAPFCLARWRR